MKKSETSTYTMVAIYPETKKRLKLQAAKKEMTLVKHLEELSHDDCETCDGNQWLVEGDQDMRCPDCSTSKDDEFNER